MIDREFLKFQWKQQTGVFEKRQDTVGITRDGVPTAVLLSMEHFEGLMERDAGHFKRSEDHTPAPEVTQAGPLRSLGNT